MSSSRSRWRASTWGPTPSASSRRSSPANSEHQVLAGERAPVRLGHGVYLSGRLEKSAMDRAVAALSDFRRQMDALGIEHYRAVATSAVRESSNKDEFIARVLDETGLRLETISGSEEARLGPSRGGASGAPRQPDVAPGRSRRRQRRGFAGGSDTAPTGPSRTPWARCGCSRSSPRPAPIPVASAGSLGSTFQCSRFRTSPREARSPVLSPPEAISKPWPSSAASPTS